MYRRYLQSLHLSSDHAAILAVPEPGSQGLTWVTAGERAVPLNTLTPGAQETLLKVLGGIFCDIEAVAESGRAPMLAAAWPALRRIPHEGFVYSVDGRPVLAAWGHAPAAASTWPDPLARVMLFEKPLFPMAAEVPQETMNGRPAATLFLIGLSAAVFLLGLILPGFGLWPFHCVLATETISLSDQTNQALLQNTQIADQQAIVPPSATPRCMAQSLPEEDWNSGNLGMLDGCWHLTSDLVLYDERTNQPFAIATWVICFDKAGEGSQTVTYQDGATCTNQVQASFTSDHHMRIDDVSACSGTRGVVKGNWICSRTSDSKAQCLGADGDDSEGTANGVFQR
jgi:hypothetical protein